MVDAILDDVKDLLLKEKGDLRVLERIKRAAENDEVISVYERDYVQKLVEKYLRPKPQSVEQTREPTELPKQEQIPKIIPQDVKEKKQFFEFKSKNPKTMKYAFAIGAIALSIILIVGVSQLGTIELPTKTGTSSAPKTSGLVINTDVSSYETGDIISISGNSNPSLGNAVALSIENIDGDLIWYEEVKIKSNGAYSTLVIAGGNGWEKSGKYRLMAEHGSEVNAISFNFKS